MNITILENKDFLKNTETVNKYKFLYIESEFSDKMIEILYYKIGISWRWIHMDNWSNDVKERFLQTENFYTNSLKNFKSQFKFYEFEDAKSAKKFLEKISKKDLNNEILEFNQYQMFWFANFAKQKSKYKYSYKEK
jgi:hypothetical protein